MYMYVDLYIRTYLIHSPLSCILLFWNKLAPDYVKLWFPVSDIFLWILSNRALVCLNVYGLFVENKWYADLHGPVGILCGIIRIINWMFSLLTWCKVRYDSQSIEIMQIIHRLISIITPLFMGDSGGTSTNTACWLLYLLYKRIIVLNLINNASLAICIDEA